MSIRARAVCLAALTTLVACSAQAASVKDIFEKHATIGIFAADCSREASRENHYYVHRLIDADHLQRDVMESSTARAFVAVIDTVTEVRPNEISVSGTQDGKPTRPSTVSSRTARACSNPRSTARSRLPAAAS